MSESPFEESPLQRWAVVLDRDNEKEIEVDAYSLEVTPTHFVFWEYGLKMAIAAKDVAWVVRVAK